MPSRALDSYATRHCPVDCYDAGTGELIERYRSIPEASRATGHTVSTMKRLLHFRETDKDGLEYDIPLDSVYETVLQKEYRRRSGWKNVVRIRRSGQTYMRFTRTFGKDGRMEIRPINDNVLVERTSEKQTSSGLILIDGENENGCSFCIVKATGPDVDSNGKICTGQKVLYKDADAQPVTFEGKDLLLICQTDILAVIVE